ncbi:LPXTG cell wall anchor domain-containing protein [Halalkalibacter suaedae]
MDWDKVTVPNVGQVPYVEEEGPEIDVSELEELLLIAKGISNEYDAYTEVSYQALQDAIVEAEAELETIQFDYQLHGALEKLQNALDGLIEIVDLGPGFRFDFGSENSPLANGYVKVSDTLIYDEERGYGFDEGTDGSRDQDGPDDLRRDFILAHNKEFKLDLANGEYDVKIYTGSNWNGNTTTYSLEGEEAEGGMSTAAGEFVEYTDTVTVEDGQLNIHFGGEWARINGIEVVAVEDFNVKFDFGGETSPVSYGWTQVANTLLYDSELGYGLNKAVATRDRGGPDDVRRDFVIDGNYEFLVDLRNGDYKVKIIAGDDIASNNSTFTIEGTDYGQISSGSGQYAELEETVTVDDGQMNIQIGGNGRINGLELYFVPEVKEPTDPTDPGTDPEEPTDPTDPGTDPEEPTEPTDPETDPKEPTEEDKTPVPGKKDKLKEKEKDKKLKGEKPVKGEEEKKLPDTATSFFNTLFIGLILVVTGGIIFFFVKRKRKTV